MLNMMMLLTPCELAIFCTPRVQKLLHSRPPQCHAYHSKTPYPLNKNRLLLIVIQHRVFVEDYSTFVPKTYKAYSLPAVSLVIEKSCQIP